MAEPLKTASFAAGLTPAQKAQMDNFIKQQNTHKELSNLPRDVANKAFNAKTPEEQQSLTKTYGMEDPLTKPSRGWMGTAWHYATMPVVEPVKKIFNTLIEISDLSTRAFRTASIAGDQNVPLFGKGNAWDIANDKGDKVFSPGRIDKARSLYGNDAITVAMRIASGEATAKILASVSDEQKKYVMFLDPLNKAIPGVNDVEKERALFDDALDLVKSAKYSPGRFVANLVDRVTPGDLVKNGFMWGAISGAVDTAYRLFADPTVLASKVRSGFLFARYSLDIVTGGTGKVAETFARPNVKAFWNTYGTKLDNYGKAQTSNDLKAMALARNELKKIAPEFGSGVIKLFQKADIKDARTAEAFFLNTQDAAKMLQGAIGRKRVLIPRMDAVRKARIELVTTANKTFNLDKFGPSILNDFMGSPVTTDGVLKILSEEPQQLGNVVKQVNSQKGSVRLSGAQIAVRIDRAKAKFSIAPLFRNNEFDLAASDAGSKIYQSARMIMPELDAKMITEAFESTDDLGKRREIFKGIWQSIAEARGLNLTESGRKIARQWGGKGGVYDIGGQFDNQGAFASDFNNIVSAPDLVDLDRLAVRSGIIDKMMGQANKEWVDKVTGVWSFGTLAGYRYAIRNAGEDLMVHLAIGGSPWGLAKNRYLSTRFNTALAAVRESGSWNDNPLGIAMKLINKKEAERMSAKILGVDDVIRSAKAEIVKLKEELKLAPDDAAKTVITEKIAGLKATASANVVEETRIIMATAFTSGRVNRFLKARGKRPLFEAESDILAEHLIYGNLENSFATIGEGAINYANGADYATNMTALAREHGRLNALTFNEPRAKNYTQAQGKRGLGRITMGDMDEGSQLAWLKRISYISNDEVGSIAVANLRDKDVAIKKILAYMEDNPSFRKSASLDVKGVSKQQHAELIYDRTRKVFEKRNANPDGVKPINDELLSKVREYDAKKGEYVVSGQLSLDDLPQLADDMPDYVVGPTLVPMSESGNITASLMTRGWTWLGLSNARLSRQPMFFEEVIKLRKQFKSSGFEETYIKSFVSKLDNPTPAKVTKTTEFAKREFANLVEERAVSQILQYVDNPLVRTQLAFGARNFSRFYRATEDFYRRVYRTVRYNPMAIRKAALTYEGISHGGFIQKDDQGEAYFVYPAIEPVYRAVQGVMTALGVPAEFKVPFPIQFGAQVKMLTPSLNQDSIIPTFSGPVAGVSMKMITNLIGFGAPGTADNITQMTMGKYAVDQPFVSSFLPAHVNRLYSAMNTDDRDGQYASAWRKAVTYLEAAGHGLPKNYEKELDEFGNKVLIANTPAELEDYRLKVKNTTLSIIGTRFVLGFFAPASPQVQLKADMATWVKDNGQANFKQVFNKLTDEYAGDYNKAMARWVELFPNEIPFTVSESERSTVAVLRYAEESGTFVDQNKELFKKYPQGAAFLIPHKSGFSWDAYKTMTTQGLKRNKTVEEYLRAVQTAADLQTYYSKKNDYESSLKDVGTDYERSSMRGEFEEWAKLFKLSRPLLQEELAQGGTKAVARLQAIDDLRRMLNDTSVKVMGKTQGTLKKMIDIYDSYKSEKSALELVRGGSKIASFMKDDVIIQLRQLSETNENTKSAYFTLFSSLLGDTDG